MRGSFLVLAAAAGGMMLGIGIERVRERPADPSPSLAVACPEPAAIAGTSLVAERIASRTGVPSAEQLVEGSARPGVPPADGGLRPAPAVHGSPRRNRQQRATSAQLDAMVALLREHDGAVFDAPDDEPDDQEVAPAAAVGEIQTKHARAVLQGMAEGFAAAMAPTANHDAPGSGTNDDGRTTR